MLLKRLLALVAVPVLASARLDRASNFAGRASAMRDDMKLLDVHGGAHTELYHADFPSHRVRIKETSGWCDPNTKSYTGYLDTDSHGRDLFFYFFLSRSKPERDDVLLWINGGPGCSSATGLFMELGPCSIADPTSLNGTEPNPYSWNTQLNTIFLDQPIGVGLSYAEHGQTVARTEAAAVDVQAFVRIFFDSFKEFQGRPFHISGESYGGRYLPIFGAAILDGNKGLEKPINLRSVIIGNGVTDRFDLTLSHYYEVCTDMSGLPPVLSVLECAAMQEILPRCEKMMKDECEDRFDAIGCQAALDFCYVHIRSPFSRTGLNPYDISKPCEGYLCYGSISDKISAYLSNVEVRRFLGADDPHVPDVFSGCSSAVGYDFNSHMDGTGKTYLYVAALLERGIKVLIYAGKYDFQCNWIHQLRWTSKLQWTGARGFNAESIEEWFVDAKAKEAGVAAGETRSFGGLSYATVRGAGHMVPYDKPVESLEMLTRWLADGKL